ncbi:hypothetical protein FQA39_LY04873 [Lamprigera yunnana]|nr:hypothetical protein FQA39_LY04873 [Lamprigera yunnana]
MLAQIPKKETREIDVTEEWTCKWREAHAILREQKALCLRKASPGVVLDSDKPHIIGEKTVGTEKSNIRQDIVRKGPRMEPQHCSIILKKGIVTLFPKPNAQIWLISNLIESPSRLTQPYEDGDRCGLKNVNISLAKEKEDFEKEQEAFQNRRKTLKDAQIQ